MPTASPPKTRRQDRAERVYSDLYRRIVTGRLAPGQKVTETALAEEAGVSRAPVREALRRLAEDGLVELVPRSGCRISRLTRRDAEVLYEIRQRLECLALDHAFDSISPSGIRALREQFLRCLKLDDRGLSRREVQLDARLHALICQASGSRDLQTLLGKLRARAQLFRIREAMAPDRARLALRGHVAILDAIASGDRDDARRRLWEHIEEGKRYALSAGDQADGSRT